MTGRELLAHLETTYATWTRHWQYTHEGVTEDLLFWGGNHYIDEEDQRERDRRRLKITGQETFNVVRHKSAQVGNSPTIVDAKPREVCDPIMQEVAVAVVEDVVSDPEKLFDDYCDIMLTGAIAAAYWMLEINHSPTLNELCFAPLDPRNVMWTPGFHNPHDLMCDGLLIEKRLSVDQIRRMAKHGWDKELCQSIKPDADGRPSAKGNDRQFPPQLEDDGCATVRFWYFKNDDSKAERERAFKPLPEGAWYMACSECGWRGEVGEGAALPENDLCPECGMDTERVEAEAEMEVRQKFKRGRRLVIEAPGQGFDRPMYDDAWPLWARSFPIGFISNYLHPHKPVGPSDTLLNWSAQLGSDLLMTMAFQRVAEFRNYYLMPSSGIVDWKGDRFEFRDDQFNTMFYKDELNPSAVQVLNGSSLDPAWNIYWNATQTVLKSVQGISDLGLTPQSSKDIAASSISQMTAQGEIPVEHLKRRWHREKARMFGIIYDLCRQTLTPDKLSTLQIEGMESFVANLSGADLPDMDFVLADAGPLGAVEKTRAEGVMLMVTAAQQAPEWLDFIAQANRIPASLLRRVKKNLVQIQERQQLMQMTAGGQPGSPTNGGSPAIAGSGEPVPPPSGVGGMEPPQ